MGPNTKILTKRDILIWTPFDSSRKNKQFKIKKVKNGLKMIELCPLKSRLKSGIILGLKLAVLATLSLRYRLRVEGEGQDTFRLFEGGFGSTLRTILPFVRPRRKMGPNTKILTKRDIALIWTPFDSSRKNKQFKITESQNRIKND